MYVDSLDILKKLTDEQAGKLIKAIASYHGGDDFELDPLLDIVITPFISQFKRDAEKYKKTCEKRALAGSMGGKQKQANLANASKCKQDLANLADTDTDTDTDKNTIVEAKPQRSKFKFNDDQYRFASEMFKRILNVAPNSKKPNLESWANTIRLLNESDGVNLNNAWVVFCWANSDSFWSTNILSASKFREQYAQLSAKMSGSKLNGANIQQQVSRPSRKEINLD